MMFSQKVPTRIPRITKRLAESVSGYIRVEKISSPDRTALAVMIERGEAEIFDSPIGRAYRLLPKTKPLLVGMTNPFGPDPSKALYPHPANTAGDRLCRKVMGLRRGQYLDAFDRVNLCTGEWSLCAARAAAAEIAKVPRRPALVLCGKEVCAAFRVPFKPFTVERTHPASPIIVILPHPSGLCRLWSTEPRAFERAREALTDAGVLPVIEQP